MIIYFLALVFCFRFTLTHIFLHALFFWGYFLIKFYDKRARTRQRKIHFGFYFRFVSLSFQHFKFAYLHSHKSFQEKDIVLQRTSIKHRIKQNILSGCVYKDKPPNIQMIIFSDHHQKWSPMLLFFFVIFCLLNVKYFPNIL